MRGKRDRMVNGQGKMMGGKEMGEKRKEGMDNMERKVRET